MGIPFIIGASQQKKRRILGFETYCAPDNFDRTAQPVDIYDVFERYYRTNSNAKFIYSVINSAISTTLASGTSYRWAETVSGVETITDVTSGNITWTTGSTKRWVIVNHTTTSSINATIGHIYAEWLYCGNKISSASQGYNQPNLKYIHIDKLDNITSYPYCAHYANALTGTLHISRNPLCTTISAIAFAITTKITGTITIPSNITTIADAGSNYGSFFGCTMSSLVFEEGIQKIGNYAFQLCNNLAGSIVFPNSLITVGAFAFDRVTKITSINLGDSVQTIGASAFTGCTSLNGELIIPSTLTSLGIMAFHQTNFTSITGGNTNFEISDNVLYDKSTSGQIKANYSAKGYAGTLTLKSDTTEIQPYCFYNNTLRTGAVTMPNTITTLGTYCFYNCTGFSGALTLSTGLTTINTSSELMFYLCNFNSISGGSASINVSDHVIYDTITTAGEIKAIYGAKAYSGSLTLRSDTTQILSNCFVNNTGRNGTLTLPTALTLVRPNAFAGCSGFTGDLNLPLSLHSVSGGNWNIFSMPGITGSFIINYPAFSSGYPAYDIGLINATGLVLPPNYSGYTTFYAISSKFSALSLHNSLWNITAGTPSAWKTFRIGATNKARLLASYPNDETDIAAYYIHIT